MLALAIEFTGVPGSSDPPVFRSFAHGRRRRFGGHSGGETPGPIPNPEVKPSRADGTVRATGWESRSPPEHLRITSRPRRGRLVPCQTVVAVPTGTLGAMPNVLRPRPSGRARAH